MCYYLMLVLLHFEFKSDWIKWYFWLLVELMVRLMVVSYFKEVILITLHYFVFNFKMI